MASNAFSDNIWISLFGTVYCDHQLPHWQWQLPCQLRVPSINLPKVAEDWSFESFQRVSLASLGPPILQLRDLQGSAGCPLSYSVTDHSVSAEPQLVPGLTIHVWQLVLKKKSKEPRIIYFRKLFLKKSYLVQDKCNSIVSIRRDPSETKKNPHVH